MPWTRSVRKALFVDKPAKAPEWKLMHRIADKALGKFERLFRGIVEDAKRGVSLKATRLALTRRDFLGLSRHVEDAWDAATGNFKADYAVLLRDVMEESANMSVAFIPTVRKAHVASDIRFDVTNPLVFEFISRQSANLVTGIDLTTRLAIRNAISRSFREGITVARTAREIRGMIGLTDAQAVAVENLRITLQQRAFEDLPKSVRDRLASFRAIGPARQGRIDEVLRRYRERLIRQRAIKIARTETIRAASVGQNSIWRIAVQDGFLDPSTHEVKFVVTPDDRLCPICIAHKQNFPTRPINGVYGNGVTTPPIHPMCRCSERIVLKVQESRIAA